MSHYAAGHGFEFSRLAMLQDQLQESQAREKLLAEAG